MTEIAIKYDSGGKIINRFFGTKNSDEWTMTQESAWPETDPAPDEIPLFYYDEASGDIRVEYETVTRPDDPSAQ